MLGQATGTLTHKIHHGLDSGEAITFPHIVFFTLLRELPVPCECIRERPPSIAPPSFSLCFLCSSLAAMMNPCSNLEEQRDPKLNEYCQVAVRVREAGRCDRQKTGKLGSNKPIHNDDGDDTFTSPTPGSSGNSSARGRFARPTQGPNSNPHETSASLPGSVHLWDKNLIDQAPAPLVTPKVQTKCLKGRGEARKNHLRSYGQTGEPNSQRPFSSEVPEEEHAQFGQRLAKLKRTGEARKCQSCSDGKTSDSSS